MTNFELNARVAMKLFPGKTIHRNGEEVRCTGRLIDFRRPHLSERLMYGIGDMEIRFIAKGHVEVNGHKGHTLSEAVAVAYVTMEN